MELRRCNSHTKDFRDLVEMLDKELHERYGIVQEQYTELNRIDTINTVLIAYSDGEPVGCGCFKEYDPATIEIKRMFVNINARGKGIGLELLSGLEDWAREKGYTYSVLETGTAQPEAIRLYEKLGYLIIDNYGDYAGNTNSICMKKNL